MNDSNGDNTGDGGNLQDLYDKAEEATASYLGYRVTDDGEGIDIADALGADGKISLDPKELVRLCDLWTFVHHGGSHDPDQKLGWWCNLRIDPDALTIPTAAMVLMAASEDREINSWAIYDVDVTPKPIRDMLIAAGQAVARLKAKLIVELKGEYPENAFKPLTQKQVDMLERREKAFELRSKGMKMIDIATELDVSEGTISRDLGGPFPE